jgi:hypothetical protein
MPAAPRDPPMLADGTYDVIVVDATDVEDTGAGPAVRLELAILAGPAKGDTVVVRTEHLAITAVDALGLPGRLVVADQRPQVVLEP